MVAWARRAGARSRSINLAGAGRHLPAALTVAAKLWRVVCEPPRTRERPLCRSGDGMGGSGSDGSHSSCTDVPGAIASACSSIEDGRSLRAPHDAYRGQRGALGVPMAGCRGSAAAVAARRALQRQPHGCWRRARRISARIQWHWWRAATLAIWLLLHAACGGNGQRVDALGDSRWRLWARIKALLARALGYK